MKYLFQLFTFSLIVATNCQSQSFDLPFDSLSDQQALNNLNIEYKNHPENLALLLHKIQLHSDLNHLDSTLFFAQRHFKLDSNSGALYLLSASALLRSHLPDSAFFLLKIGNNKFPKNPQISKALANHFSALQSFDHAIRFLKKAISNLKNDSELHYLLGSAHLENKKPNLAFYALSYSLALTPKSSFSSSALKKLYSILSHNQLDPDKFTQKWLSFINQTQSIKTSQNSPFNSVYTPFFRSLQQNNLSLLFGYFIQQCLPNPKLQEWLLQNSRSFDNLHNWLAIKAPTIETLPNAMINDHLESKSNTH